MTEDIQQAGIAGQMAERMVALVIERQGSKEFRVPEPSDSAAYRSRLTRAKKDYCKRFGRPTG